MASATDKKRVAVGLSGGVDSAVAAHLLIEAGHDVVGVTMTIWDGRELTGPIKGNACYGADESHDVEEARHVADHLKIPYHVVDLSQEYNKQILDFCGDQYRTGSTPNPCVHCNRKMKFGLIPQRLREQGVEIDAFATGHYAIVEYDEGRRHHVLKKGRDPRKEQSYFLYGLSREQLAEVILPLGSLTKVEVRQIARQASLPVAEKKESQDFAAGDYGSVFGLKDRPGPIQDVEGNVVGEHQGIHRYTIGQRKGLGIASLLPMYVKEIDAETNAIVVAQETGLYGDRALVEEVNWMSVDCPVDPISVQVKIRYRHDPAPAVMAPKPDGRVDLVFEDPQRAIAPGQAAVFYQDDLVLGGGLIANPSRP